MQFGYFDDERREYVITTPDTPLPWINYLGFEDYFGIISNTAGGYSFYKDARLRRLTRYRYNDAPLDSNGRYIYLRDDGASDPDFWSPTWQPTCKKLDDYECRHGLGYTSIQSTHAGIRAKIRYFVPLGANLEIWELNLTNQRGTEVNLSIFGSVEFCLWDAMDDATNFQRNYSIGEVEVADGVASLKGGVDLEMPGPRDRRVKAVIDAVRTGNLDEALLDDAVRRILNIVFKAAETPKGGSFDQAAHHALARKVAAEGIVLLKNNGVLPLHAQQHIAVIGHSAKEPYFQGGGSSHVNSTQVDIPYVELQKISRGAELSYAEGYSEDEGINQSLINDAVEIAQPADVALLYIALPKTKESEGYDRQDLDLTPQQIALIKAVTAVQPETVIILNNGAPVVMSEWFDGTAAVLEAWMMGQAGGGAIADILFGVVNPSGKLAETFPLKLIDTPAIINYPGECGQVRYGEGIFIGYRYYEAKEIPVHFPFGYGLSYATFLLSKLRVSATSFKDVDGLTVSVDVTNTGKVAGKEVVQVYVHDQKSSLIRPLKELKGFAKVELQPGETKTISINLDYRAFAFYHPAYKQWITENGSYDILVGSSSADIRCVETIELQSTMELPCILQRDSTLNEWMEDPRGKQVLIPKLREVDDHKRTIFRVKEGETPVFDPTDFLLDMPLTDYFNFLNVKLEQGPEKIVDELLAEVHKANK